MSGFSTTQTDQAKAAVKHLVINGAFNPDNSGGPVISPEGTIVGVVVTKWVLPLPAGLASALKALDENKSGLQYSGTQGGKPVTYAESQLTAALLEYYRQVRQIFIGEAITALELTSFLDERKIPWNAPVSKLVKHLADSVRVKMKAISGPAQSQSLCALYYSADWLGSRCIHSGHTRWMASVKYPRKQ